MDGGSGNDSRDGAIYGSPGSEPGQKRVFFSWMIEYASSEGQREMAEMALKTVGILGDRADAAIAAIESSIANGGCDYGGALAMAHSLDAMLGRGAALCCERMEALQDSAPPSSAPLPCPGDPREAAIGAYGDMANLLRCASVAVRRAVESPVLDRDYAQERTTEAIRLVRGELGRGCDTCGARIRDALGDAESMFRFTM